MSEYIGDSCQPNSLDGIVGRILDEKARQTLDYANLDREFLDQHAKEQYNLAQQRWESLITAVGKLPMGRPSIRTSFL